MPQRVTPLLHFELNGSPFEYKQEFNFLALTLDSSLSFKLHLTKIGNKIFRLIGLLHKLKHIFPSYMCVGPTKGTYRRDIKMIVNHDYIKQCIIFAKKFLG